MKKRFYILFCIVRELLFEIPKNLRLASIKWDGNSVYTYYYFNKEISERDRDNLDETDTRFMTHVLDHEIKYSSFQCIRVDEPTPIPYEGDCFFAIQNETDTGKQEQLPPTKQLTTKQLQVEKKYLILFYATLAIRFLTPKNLRLGSIKLSQDSVCAYYYIDGEIRASDTAALRKADAKLREYCLPLEIDHFTHKDLRVDEPNPIHYEGECFFARKERDDS